MRFFWQVARVEAFYASYSFMSMFELLFKALPLRLYTSFVTSGSIIAASHLSRDISIAGPHNSAKLDLLFTLVISRLQLLLEQRGVISSLCSQITSLA